MGIKDVWGFDPEEAIRHQNSFRSVAGRTDIEDHSQDEKSRIPHDAHSQINELRRLFRL
jgi:hypothetical protein